MGFLFEIRFLDDYFPAAVHKIPVLYLLFCTVIPSSLFSPLMW